jgi:hypothetical protein
MKYAAEMDSVTMIYIPSFFKDWFRHSKVNGGIHRQDGDRISLLYEIRLKRRKICGKTFKHWKDSVL